MIWVLNYLLFLICLFQNLQRNYKVGIDVFTCKNKANNILVILYHNTSCCIKIDIFTFYVIKIGVIEQFYYL